MKISDTIIIGAGSAGLACNAALSEKGIRSLILEGTSKVASRWRGHYDRLHLHTDKKASSLPFRAMPTSYPKYPARDEVVSYLEDYADAFDADIIFNEYVSKASHSDDGWTISTRSGAEYLAQNLVVCSGKTNKPRMVSKPGLDTFPGTIIHSADYKNGRPFEGQNVLVIGFGNSGCEIAICLHEHGASPSMSVRSGVNVVPRDILGIPALSLGKLTSKFPPHVSDTLNAPLLKFLYGDITRYGLRKLPYGPITQIKVHGRIPLLDIGTIDLIRKGEITAYPDIQKISGDSIVFEDGRADRFDAIIMATGYDHGLSDFIDIDEDREAEFDKPVYERRFAGRDNLYLCGLYVSPRGMLNEAGKEALFVANAISDNSYS